MPSNHTNEDLALPRKPFMVSDEGVSMSLAGVQDKIGVGIDDQGRIAIPHDVAPSTHILKPDSRDLVGSVQNEALCLTLARRCGIAASRVTTGTAGARSYLLVTCYDRVAQNGRWRRLHQEEEVNAMPAGTHNLMPKFVEIIEERARRIIAGLSDRSGVDADDDEISLAQSTGPSPRSPDFTTVATNARVKSSRKQKAPGAGRLGPSKRA